MSRVSIVKIENDDVEQAIRKAIELIGGLEKYINAFSEVLLKPNMFASSEKKEERDKIITDPRVLDALCKMLIELDKDVVIGDTCGRGTKRGTRSVLETSGFLEVSAKYDRVDARSLEKHGPIISDINGKKLKKANISKDVIDSQAIINVPKMKTHKFTLYTGAIKNLFGTVCGADKTRIHSLGADIFGFSQCLVDLYAFEKSKIKLNVMDAIIALEGMGPGVSGNAVEMNLILASDNAVALDAVAFSLMGHASKKILMLKYAAEQGLGPINLKDIDIIGEKIENHQRKFKLPKTSLLVKIPYQRFTSVPNIPEYVSGCTACKNCEHACPEKVIEITQNEKGEYKPIIDFKGCISCFTCVEICPEACYIRRSMSRKKTVIIGLTIILSIVGLIIALVLLL